MSDRDAFEADMTGAGGWPPGLLLRKDGVFLDVALAPELLRSGIDRLYQTGWLLAGLDYPLLLQTLFQAPGPRRTVKSEAALRIAARVAPFAPERRRLYEHITVHDDVAEFYFEAVPSSEDSRVPVTRDVDEMVAALWRHGVHYGVDSAAVRALIVSGRAERAIVARALAPQPGREAQLTPVAQGIERDDAPRERADGRFDLLSFKNRHPHIKKHTRLLRSSAATPGLHGYALSGAVLPPPPPAQVDLRAYAGEGTRIERVTDGEFLVAAVDGYVQIDAQGRISIENKIVSHDGVSSRTTGNLKLRGAYEEFGEVQEQRLIDGSDMTLHGDVYGRLHSHGGLIELERNLVGGTAYNEHGDIHVGGVASGAVLQARDGTVRLARAESCVISGTRVVIAHASNCEIIADEVELGVAEGCAVAARQMRIGQTRARKQVEMLVLPLVPDLAPFEERIADAVARAEQQGQLQIKRQQEVAAIAQLPDMRSYLSLTGQLRRSELVLKEAQQVLYDKLAARMAPVLKEMARLRLDIKQAEVMQAQLQAQAGQFAQERLAAAAHTHCVLTAIEGDTIVRTLLAPALPARVYDRTPKEIKALLHSATPGTLPVFVGSSGALDWTYVPEEVTSCRSD
ncbi:flagellar assembly protein A [Janthinobacterium aquaticum]|uniref:flagellar assembly protein A n=1 Tax=Janthinobacterium sp. FT58W TaxID=2654254 RepID=UPI0012645B27|nr:flagellar assembly protein A [Janthinobacterium sp. FT58W]KAB8045359.1 DUF342 domain-containing protein [Janthinobacterium sp. FT58W]